MPGMDETLLREVVTTLAGIDRPSASPGERRAAEYVAEQLRAYGVRAALEEHPAHGTYWWPLGLPLAAGVLAGIAGLRGRRWPAALLAGAAAGLLADDVVAGRRPLRRRLPQRRAVNVVGWAGDPTAERTVVVMAHHDAPHTGAFFDFQQWLGARLPASMVENLDTSPPMYWIIAGGGPGLVAAGAVTGSRALLKAGTAASAFFAAAFAQIGASATSPGANDDASGVAGLVALAQALAERPVTGVRVLLLSAGAEESFQEGMLGFAERHFGELPRHRTWFVNLETVGSQHLVLLEGEGPMQMLDADAQFKDTVEAVADRAGIPVRRGLRSRVTTDSLVPIKAGYRTATLVSVDDSKALRNYHTSRDLPEHLDYGTVAHAAELAEAVVRHLADG